MTDAAAAEAAPAAGEVGAFAGVGIAITVAACARLDRMLAADSLSGCLAARGTVGASASKPGTTFGAAGSVSGNARLR
ncbi:MAG: hypothetical protein IT379_22620, partial [Deltaproteobacteria bacterium]|nr:hypothetical protein [Deltaproteobacteria bacterium]